MDWELGDASEGLVPPKLRILYSAWVRQEGRSAEDDRALVRLVMDRAREIVAHPSRPTRTSLEPFPRFPQGELALEESLEESPVLREPDDYLVERVDEKPFPCIAMVDLSSSMAGDKHLLASVAIAVLMLETPPRDCALTAFSSQSTTLKAMRDSQGPEGSVLRFLRAVPRGFTNLRAGLEAGLKEYARGGRDRRRVGLLVTDGRATEGGDPMEVARRFDFLVVMHLHGPGSDVRGSRDLAAAGAGVCLEVERFEDLPRRVYDAVRYIARRG